jgi:hypothetical protein
MPHHDIPSSFFDQEDLGIVSEGPSNTMAWSNDDLDDINSAYNGSAELDHKGRTIEYSFPPSGNFGGGFPELNEPYPRELPAGDLYLQLPAFQLPADPFKLQTNVGCADGSVHRRVRKAG